MAYGFLGAAYGCHVVHALPRHVGRAFERGGYFREFEGIAVQLRVAAVGAGHGFHAHERGGGHLPACHAVDGVVHENHRDVFAAVQGVDSLARTDTGDITVALIGEHEAVGPQALAGSGERGGAAVGGFLPVDVDVFVGEHGAAHGTDADGLFFHAHFGNHLCHELVYHAVRAAGAIVHIHIVEQRWLFVDQMLGTDYFFACHSFFSRRVDK